jgi:hypothetical protein
VDSLQVSPTATDPSDNIPGLILKIAIAAKEPLRTVLYGGSLSPVAIPAGSDTLLCAVLRKTDKLPIAITLVKFSKEDYAQTSMAKEYRSTIHAHGLDIDRDAVISMNKPFHYRHYTFYQSSYSQSGNRQSSTFAVVENQGKWVPYCAGLLMALGLLIHFGAQLFGHALKRREP